MSLDCYSSVECIPSEVWQLIFAYLPARQLIRIRQVCSVWRDSIDGLTGKTSLWLTHCKHDFSDVYKVAYHKARVGTQWYNIYRSLSLWSHLPLAKEIRKEFTVTDYNDDDDLIDDLQVLQDGIIGVLKTNKIVYYNIETMEPARSHSIKLDDPFFLPFYTKYDENQHIIQYHDFSYHLFVIFKTVDNPNYKMYTTFKEVEFSLLVNREIFYVDLQDNIYNCKLLDGRVKATKLTQASDKIMCLGYTDQLNYLTKQSNIYSLVNGKSMPCSNLKNCGSYILDELYKYNLLETVNWDNISYWLRTQQINAPGLLESIYRVKVYGKVVLVCCGDSDFYIYYDPFINGVFDILNSQPVRKYSFKDPQDNMGLIVKADALEAVDGHRVVVATSKKIIALDFIHCVPKCT